MHVSIVIINFNSQQYTLDCVKSIIRQVKDCSYEVIIVDNDSQTFDQELFLKLDSKIKICINQENFGFAGGNNVGINHASGEIILLLNNDTKLENNAIKICAEQLTSNENIGVVGAGLLYEDGSYQASSFPFPSMMEQVIHLLRLNKLNFFPGHLKKYRNLEREADTVTVDWVSGAFYMFRRSDLAQFPNNRLQTDFFMYCEDIQWSYYFKKKLNKEIVYCPRAKVIHYMGKSLPVDLFEKKLKNYFPNLQRLLLKEKGWLYTKIFFLFLILRYASDIKRISFLKGIVPLLRLFLGLKNSNQFQDQKKSI